MSAGERPDAPEEATGSDAPPGATSPLGAMDQLGRANALLSSLHDVVRSMTTPLSVDELIPAIRPQLEELFHPHVLVLLAGDPAAGRMQAVHVEGCRLPPSIAAEELPAVLARGPRGRPQLVEHLDPADAFGEDVAAGAYVWLFSRGRTAGLLAMELDDAAAIGPGISDTLERLGLPLALALDNAVWFRRLRTLGAEEERQRLGATLHDRFAQSLAYVAMSLDRAAKRHPEDGELGQLRLDVRATLGELRETLRELRLAVDEDRDLGDALAEHLERVEDRHGVITELRLPDEPVHLAQGIAQQLLRSAQELTALAAVEHGATTVTVSIEAPPGRVALSVSDDGRGRAEEELGLDARSRLAAVRERADAIGGRVVVQATPSQGTVVRIELRGTM